MGFKKGDLVLWDRGNNDVRQGVILQVDNRRRQPVQAQFTDGSTRSFTIDGRSSRACPITLTLEPIGKRSDIDTPKEKEDFKVLDPVLWLRPNLKNLEGIVVSVDYFKKGFPILVKFDDGKCRSFTRDGRLIEGGIVDLVFRDEEKRPDKFKKGDAVMYEESHGSWLHGVVCYVDQDGRGFPVEVELNGTKRKLSFTKDGRYLPNGSVILMLTSEFDAYCKTIKARKLSETFLAVVKNSKGVQAEIPRIATNIVPPTELGYLDFPLLNTNSNLDETLKLHDYFSKEALKQTMLPKSILTTSEKLEPLPPDVPAEEKAEDYDHVSAPHYRKSPIEAIDIIERIYGAEATALWCEITALKYRLRLGHKPTSPIEDDLKKESWYLEKRAELLEKNK